MLCQDWGGKQKIESWAGLGLNGHKGFGLTTHDSGLDLGSSKVLLHEERDWQRRLVEHQTYKLRRSAALAEWQSLRR